MISIDRLNSVPTSRNDPCVCPAVAVETLTLALSQGEKGQKKLGAAVKCPYGQKACQGEAVKRQSPDKPSSERPYNNRRKNTLSKD
jgi:hypothetical protein